MKIGFDNEKYLQEQSQYILERVSHYDKLYLEFGGKLMNDLHAKRVLPGYDENVKCQLLSRIKDSAEIIICVYAGDLERNKMHGDVGIPYHLEVLQLIDSYRKLGIQVNSVVMTRYNHQAAAKTFINKLKRRQVKVYKHEAIEGYPRDVNAIVSNEGYGKNPYIETTKPIVVVTGPGPGSGKLATCLNQLYHEKQRGVVAGYSKFETFPVWNVPLKHPLNLAYEAATADLNDVNMIDSFHLDAYNVASVNYNRDMEMYPVVKRIIERITGEDCVYKSPTDMGVNRVGFGIVNDSVVRHASEQEIIRRYLIAKVDYAKGTCEAETVDRCYSLLEQLGLKEENRLPVEPARQLSQNTKNHPSVMAICFEDGTIITGKGSALMNCSASMLLNALKVLGELPDIHLLKPQILKPVLGMKSDILHYQHNALDIEDVLMMLSMLAVSDENCAIALAQLPKLKGLAAHATHILSQSDLTSLRQLGIDVTCDPVYPTKDLFYQ